VSGKLIAAFVPPNIPPNRKAALSAAFLFGNPRSSHSMGKMELLALHIDPNQIARSVLASQ